jgi:hypothetical protein
MNRSQRKLGLFPESPDKGRALLHSSQRLSGMTGEVVKVFGAEVGHLMAFPVTPHIFGGIKFRGIGRQPRQMDTPVLLGQEVTHTAATVSRQPIPNDQDLSLDVALQMAEEINNLWRLDGAGVETEVELPPGDASDGREALPVEVKLQLRGLTARSPCAANMGAFRKTAFVYEYDGSSFAAGFFLRAGQVYRFQRRIASSSRSIAFLEGRWQLQPRPLRSLETWAGWYETPHTSWMTRVIRGNVHRLVPYPRASGPSMSTRRTRTFWRLLKRGLRPARPADRNPRMPSCLSARAQRDTEVALTFSCRATSACFMPLRSRAAPSRRRCSSTLKACVSRLMPFGFPMPKRLSKTEGYV